ncbi:hypothetical protein LMG19282_00246 [Cupriavidus campinensis]|nr:hypothetical protein LMG19282_00246 [Cupriavidus campinensis]
MVTIGDVSRAWASALNRATGRTDLMLGTLNFAAGFLSTTHLLAKHARYCRECLRDASAASAEPWIPLIWYIDVVTVCPIHRVRLRQRQCGAPDNAIYTSVRKILPENCWTCGKLFCLCDKTRTINASAQEVAVAELVGELVAAGTSGIFFPSDALQLCNETMPTVLGENWLVRSADACNVEKSGVHRMFRQAGARTSLPGLVHFCLCNQLSLAQIARGRAEYRRCDSPSVHRTRPYRPAQEKAIRSEIQQSIDAGGVRSLRDLARKLNHCPKTLKHVAADLVPALNLANAAFRVAERNLSAARQEEECRQIIEHLLRQGVSLTLRNVRAHTGHCWHWSGKRAQIFLKMREKYR